MNYQFIISKSDNGIGHITLNSEKTLNALNQKMAEEMIDLLNQWENDPNISCIFLDASGERAFCAGGDIKNLYLALKDQKEEKINQTCLNFFITEYTLDYKIHTYSKPIISWNTGITMGGGMGLMNGASHRIVTETSLLAMPEVSIGLYPDVGATYFFNKLPPGVGKFLGVTGARFNAGDALTLGLADFFVTSQLREEVLASLKKISWTNSRTNNDSLIKDCLKSLSSKDLPSPFSQPYLSHFAKLASVTEINDFEEVIKDFPQDEWIQKSIETFKKGSPTSAAIILKQLELGKDLTLKQVFMSELNLSVHCSLNADFPEGVRALLIDKDQSAKWSPASIDQLTQEAVSSYFIPLWNKDDHPFRAWN